MCYFQHENEYKIGSSLGQRGLLCSTSSKTQILELRPPRCLPQNSCKRCTSEKQNGFDRGKRKLPQASICFCPPSLLRSYALQTSRFIKIKRSHGKRHKNVSVSSKSSLRASIHPPARESVEMQAIAACSQPQKSWDRTDGRQMYITVPFFRRIALAALAM